MNIGKLNRKVTLQSPGTTQDAYGDSIAGWVTLATVWAHVRYLNGIESIKADATAAIAKASIRIRFRTDVTADMRVMLGATVFQITAVLPDEAKREHVDLVCEVLPA